MTGPEIPGHQAGHQAVGGVPHQVADQAAVGGNRRSGKVFERRRRLSPCRRTFEYPVERQLGRPLGQQQAVDLELVAALKGADGALEAGIENAASRGTPPAAKIQEPGTAKGGFDPADIAGAGPGEAGLLLRAKGNSLPKT